MTDLQNILPGSSSYSWSLGRPLHLLQQLSHRARLVSGSLVAISHLNDLDDINLDNARLVRTSLPTKTPAVFSNFSNSVKTLVYASNWV